jgi:YD repeat-containing protein
MSKVTEYSYDDLGRLIGVKLSNGAEAIYNYDAAGNRTTVLEIPALIPTFTPVTVAGLAKPQHGDFLESAMMVLLSSGEIVGWGNNLNGVLANGNSTDTNTPVQKVLFDPNTVLPPTGATIVDWTFTNANLYVVFSNGWVYSAGKNAMGQLGHGDLVARNALKRIDSFVNSSVSISKVWACGSSRETDGGGCVYFQASDFALYACGEGAMGNLGNAGAPTSNLSTPLLCTGVPATTPSHVVHVELAAGRNGFSAYLLFNDGLLKVAGLNNCGQLGVGSTTNVTGGFVNATKLGGTNITNAVSVSATVGSAAATTGAAIIVDAAGTAWSTGRNNVGQLGLGNTVDRSRFEQILVGGVALANLVEARLGGGSNPYGYALNSAGTLYTWGYNGANNLLKNNTTTPVSTPSSVSGLPSGVSKIFFPLMQEGATSSAQLIVLLTNGRIIFAGGDNGQLSLASAVNTGLFKYLPAPRQILDGTETPVNMFIHGTEALQRWFILTDKGNLYACGSNADTVGTGGVSSGTSAASVEWFKIDFNNFAIIA